MFSRMTTSAVALVAFATPGLADVTPAEVWQAWLDYYTANGYSVTAGGRSDSDGALMLTDVDFAFADPMKEGGLRIHIPQVTLAPTGDGQVRTTFADSSTIALEFRNDEGEPVEIAATASMPGNDLLTSGTPEDMSHEGSMPELVLTVDSVTSGGRTITAPASLRLLNTAYRQQIADGDMIDSSTSVTSERAEFSGEFEDTESEAPGTLTLSGTLEGLQSSSKTSLPRGIDVSENLNAGLHAGMTATANLVAQRGSVDFSFEGTDDEGQPQSAKGTMSGQGFGLAVGISGQGLSYQAEADAMTAEISGNDMPAPITYSVESTSFDLQIPVLKSDAPVPFKLAYSIGGLTLGDAVWNLIDSEGALPRDPASLDIDITGMTRVALDLFDPANARAETAAGDGATEDAAADGATEDAAADGATEDAATDNVATDNAVTDNAAPSDDMAADGAETAEAEEPAAPMPFEPTELTINQMALEMLGASISAEGSLSVPEGGTIEEPVGRITATLDGVNGLIDRLVQMGLVGQDEVAGYRLMLAMFARPAPEGGDRLIGEFEFREGGQIFANGQQVQ